MDKPKILSGYELVARGTTKTDGSLPEIGLKDVIPNGSWLEQKQIQSALEARKHLIEVERIEKCGVLSHAEWREDLMLAEVTQLCGGYWQYLGHKVGHQLFLKPEEALFLIEINSLCLKHNEVIVSLQQAYSLLLRSEISLLQYKVYASLGRLGYKVFRHDKKLCEKKVNESSPKAIEKAKDGKAVESDKDSKAKDGNIAKSDKEDSKAKGGKAVENDKEDSKAKGGKTVEIDKKDIKAKLVESNEEDSKAAESDKEDNKAKGGKAVENDNEDSKAKGSEEETADASKMDIDASQQIDLRSECNGTQDYVSSSKCSETDDAVKANGDLLTNEIDIEVATKDLSGTNVNDSDNICNSSVPIENNEIKTDMGNSTNMNAESDNAMDVIDSTNISDETDKDVSPICNAQIKNKYLSNHTKLEMLQNRKLKSCNSTELQKSFEIVPDICQKQVVSVQTAEEKYVPSNICFNNTAYTLHVDKIRSKGNDRPTSTDSRTYSIPDEVSGAHVRRVGDASPNITVNNWSQPFPPNETIAEQNHHFRQFNLWRPRTNMNFFQFNLLFQRQFMQNTTFRTFQNALPRFHMFPPGHLRPPPLIQFANAPNLNSNSQNQNVPNNRKRMRNGAKQYHLQAIKRLSVRLKHLMQLGTMQSQNVVSLQRLIQTYNTRYKTNLTLTEDLNIVNNENIIETIDLDDEDESQTKRPRTESMHHKYEENLNKIKQLALKLKDLSAKNKATARHRRAFSNLVKRFNKSYNADVTMTNNEVYDRRRISLDSSSDSDCIVEEPPATPSGKKLRNPFNILKRLSEKHNSSISKPTTSNNVKTDEGLIHAADKIYSRFIKETFKDWLPSEEDFGRAEVAPKSNMYNYLIESKREEYLYEFIRNQENSYDNWLDLKTTFFKSIAETAAFVHSEIAEEDKTELKSVIGPEDCTDMPSILSKLSIIPSYNQVDDKTSLCIAFDVYNRDVQNFRKSNRPKPHFRVVCLNESSSFPSGNDVKALIAQYNDNVAILFAVVSLGSISYLQINPTNLPVYIPSNDFT